MTEKEIRDAARRCRLVVKYETGHAPRVAECETYIRESLAGDGFAKSHETELYRRHGVAYCHLVAAWHELGKSIERRCAA